MVYFDESKQFNDFDFSSVYRHKAFTEAMEKYFDTTDEVTRRTLLAVNEADQAIVMTSLSNKLYKHVVDKVDDIDFGTIPASKGDFTKIDKYDELVDCVNIINEIMVNYKQPTTSIETVRIAIQNLVDRADLFEKAYKLNVELPIIVYNTIALAIVSSVSYLIASCIEFVKLPDNEGFDIALNKAANMKARDHLLFKDLEKFNRICANGELDRAIEFVIKQNTSKNFTGAGIAGGAALAILGVILIIIPVIRELIFFFYYTKIKVSDYFDIQSTLLTMNAYNIENNLTGDDKGKKEIANKQRKIADTFKKISNKFAIDSRTGTAKAEKEIKILDSEKYKTAEVLDTTPDSATSALF